MRTDDNNNDKNNKNKKRETLHEHTVMEGAV
jgi:hypothetical protein